jgi:hypothetical protein
LNRSGIAFSESQRDHVGYWFDVQLYGNGGMLLGSFPSDSVRGTLRALNPKE